ncbi:hypothetical protein AUJ10_03810 [Candidatus Pacearchaeota archaeon CG1_02_31_27]|nr:MAG: hypothetical protein AUJ10_03810 [Candidatus Pacearchaeota archaeon CG1_02_31_27]
MKELELTVRILMFGEYENTCTFYIEIPSDTPEDKEMEVMMDALAPEVEGEYGYYDEWEDGNISWTLEQWEVINENA